jgi:hypothetical protein
MALPLNVAGIILLRLIKDVNDSGLDDLTLRAFRDAGFPEIDGYFPSPRERASQDARRSSVALLYALGIVAVSIAMTIAGMTNDRIFYATRGCVASRTARTARCRALVLSDRCGCVHVTVKNSPPLHRVRTLVAVSPMQRGTFLFRIIRAS